MIRHITYIFKHALTLLFIKIPVQILGIPVVTFALLFYIRDFRVASSKLIDQRLPKFLNWFDVGDEIDKKYGINGDLGYQSGALVGSETALKELELQAMVAGKGKSRLKIYWMRFNWLALRNPANGFQYNALGAKPKLLFTPIEYVSKTSAGTVRSSGVNMLRQRYDDLPQVGNWTHHGYRYVELEGYSDEALQKPVNVREYYLVYLYPAWLSYGGQRRCFRARIGHKIGNNPLVFSREVLQWAFSVNPLKSYTGEV